MPLQSPTRPPRRSGFSLLDVLAVVAIVGIFAVVVFPRIPPSARTANSHADAQNKAEINAAVDRWYFEKGTWPAHDLRDIAGDANYFLHGIPRNPITGANYTLDSATHRAQ